MDNVSTIYFKNEGYNSIINDVMVRRAIEHGREKVKEITFNKAPKSVDRRVRKTIKPEDLSAPISKTVFFISLIDKDISKEVRSI